MPTTSERESELPFLTSISSLSPIDSSFDPAFSKTLLSPSSSSSSSSSPSPISTPTAADFVIPQISNSAPRRSLTAFTRGRTFSVFAPRKSSTSDHFSRASTSLASISKPSRQFIPLGSGEDIRSDAPLIPSISDRSSDSEQLAVANLLDQPPPNPPHRRNMHQTSSRLLRMTEDDRPFTKDFMDLFSTLVVSLKLDSHRVRFTKYDHSFTSEEAINNLGSLKFSQSNRMPDPKDPSRIVTTTTTTTFSMAKEMARSVCQRFADARFIEPVDGKPIPVFPLKGSLFHLTPKGINILQRFCQRNGITAQHVIDVLESPRNTMQLVNLERDMETDKLSHDRATIEVIFRRFAGQDGPNVKSSISTSDSDSLSDYSNGLVGVKMARERKVGDRFVPNTFTGKAAVDWLMDCSTTIERRETVLIAELFVKYGLMTIIQHDGAYPMPESTYTTFQPSKYAIYAISEKGQSVCGWIARDKVKDIAPFDSRGLPKDSNNARLTHILHDPALRLLFREFLRFSLCEENLSFYVDVSEFTSNYHKAEKTGAFKNADATRETLAAAYGLYNAFLAPGSPCELNIDHALRNSLASRMTKAVGDDESMFKSLQEVVHLFEMAQTSVFKLMSSDSIPKFMRDPKYASVLQEHDMDTVGPTRSYSPTPGPLPERSMSRSAR